MCHYIHCDYTFTGQTESSQHTPFTTHTFENICTGYDKTPGAVYSPPDNLLRLGSWCEPRMRQFDRRHRCGDNPRRGHHSMTNYRGSSSRAWHKMGESCGRQHQMKRGEQPGEPHAVCDECHKDGGYSFITIDLTSRLYSIHGKFPF